MRTPQDLRHGTVSLTVASPSEPQTDDQPSTPYVPWLLAALVWTAAVAVLGWVVVGALAGVSWLTAAHTPAADVVATIGQGWLALHGVPATLGGATIRMVPLGLSLMLVAGCAFAAHHAGGQYPLPEDAARSQRWLAGAAVLGTCVGAYVLIGAILAVVVGSPAQFGQAVPGLLLVPLLGALPGALAGVGVGWPAATPPWVRRLPRALGLGVLVLLVGALAALVVALVAHGERVAALHEALEPDAAGTVILTLVQAAYLPNLLAWAGAFVLGAGVTLGQEGLVAPGVAEPVLLPAVPVLGAVPSVPGVADWAWLVVGPVAGLVAAWWLLRGSTSTALVGLWQGAVAGVLPGVVWVAASWFARGDLGTQVMAGFGPRYPELLLWGTLPLAAAGALFGLGRALWLARRAPAPAEEPTAIG